MIAGLIASTAGPVLDGATVSADGRTVTAVLKADGSAIAAAVAAGSPLLYEFPTPSRGFAEEMDAMRAQNNLKQIGLALHNYHSAHGHFPPAVIEENGVKHSWRVAILPFLDAQAVYHAYRKTEPWDSPHNQALLAQIPEVFQQPGEALPGFLTPYLAVVGQAADGRGATAWRGGRGAGRPARPPRRDGEHRLGDPGRPRRRRAVDQAGGSVGGRLEAGAGHGFPGRRRGERRRPGRRPPPRSRRRTRRR